MGNREFNAITIKDELVAWIRDWFERNGKNCIAVIGISGGKDSSVVAALCKEALGVNRVFGVMMPNGEQKDISDSIALCEHLGIKNTTINIAPAVNAIIDSLKAAEKVGRISEQAMINTPARVRMTTLYAVSQTFGNGRVVNTCNLSEDIAGFSTRYGDSVGDFSPLARLTTDEVVAIGDVLGLPYELTHKTPSDGLCGKSDEDSLGFKYSVENVYIRTGVCEDEVSKRLIDERFKKNLFKLELMEHYEPRLNNTFIPW